jgi:hypothetical protein
VFAASAGSVALVVSAASTVSVVLVVLLGVVAGYVKTLLVSAG